MDDRREYTQNDVDNEAEKYIQETCIDPIFQITREICFIAVSGQCMMFVMSEDLPLILVMCSQGSL